MPFIESIRRLFVDRTGTWGKVGELCYMKYLPMIKKWRNERRWTTAHDIFKETFDVNDEQAAKTLAFLVLFHKEVMPYEMEMAAKNGDIE